MYNNPKAHWEGQIICEWLEPVGGRSQWLSRNLTEQDQLEKRGASSTHNVALSVCCVSHVSGVTEGATLPVAEARTWLLSVDGPNAECLHGGASHKLTTNYAVSEVLAFGRWRLFSSPSGPALPPSARHRWMFLGWSLDGAWKQFDWRALRDVDLRKVPARPNRLVERQETTNKLRLLDAPAQVSGDALTAVWARWNVCRWHENICKGTLKWPFLCFSKASPGSCSRVVLLGKKRSMAWFGCAMLGFIVVIELRARESYCPTALTELRKLK